MAEYYRQRASAGLIITEATHASRTGCGYPDTPGIATGEQIMGWQRVHSAGGSIVLQMKSAPLWTIVLMAPPMQSRRDSMA